MTDEREIIRILTPYLMAFPQSKMNEGALLVYSRALKELSPDEIDAAMLKLMRTVKFFPTVAEIFEAARDIREFAAGNALPAPDEAWHEAMEQAKKNFTYRPWEFSCPEVEKAVRHFGKEELCSLETDAVNTARAQFMRIYTSIVERGKERETNAAVMSMLPDSRKAALRGVPELTGALAENLTDWHMKKGA